MVILLLKRCIRESEVSREQTMKKPKRWVLLTLSNGLFTLIVCIRGANCDVERWYLPPIWKRWWIYQRMIDWLFLYLWLHNWLTLNINIVINFNPNIFILCVFCLQESSVQTKRKPWPWLGNVDTTWWYFHFNRLTYLTNSNWLWLTHSMTLFVTDYSNWLRGWLALFDPVTNMLTLYL